MRRVRRTFGTAGTLIMLGLITALVVPMTNLVAADHLDSPVISSRLEIDINDTYAFAGTGSSGPSTVLVTTVSPAAIVSTFGDKDNTRYVMRIDQNGDAVADLAYSFEFTTQGNQKPGQMVQVRMAKGMEAESLTPGGKLLGIGRTNEQMSLKGGGRFFAGLRSDPFFFDLDGFRGTVENLPPLRLDGSVLPQDALGNDPTDFFADLNTLAIVIEVPDTVLGGPIAFWATTSAMNPSGNWVQADRFGRPAINTVVNSTGPIVGAPSGQKVVFNAAEPANDGAFTAAVVNALQAFSSLDSEGPYSDGQANALAGVLLPDVLTFDKGSNLPAPLNGRALADDVIDVELRVVTGGDPLGLFEDRDADGGVNSDGVGPHTDYLAVFPYLGVPHS
ncbi:MAG: DUF4331 family protein [Acidimicrobiia bacterium]